MPFFFYEYVNELSELVGPHRSWLIAVYKMHYGAC
ncbi:hypothetical protein FHS85_005339 [Rhodoligotrophos appendicifer]